MLLLLSVLNYVDRQALSILATTIQRELSLSDKDYARIGQVFLFEGLTRVAVERAAAGDIVLVTGIDELTIGTTLASVEQPEALPPSQAA